MTQQTQQALPPESLARGYEREEFRLRWFVGAVVCLVLFAAAMHVGLWYLTKADSRPRLADRPASSVAEYRPTMSAPPLQSAAGHDRLPRQDLAAMRQAEDRIFADLGWKVDGQTHRATPPDALVRRVADRYASNRSKVSRLSTTSRPAATAVTPIPGVDQGGTQ
jgi:hypothetical protein